MSLCSVKISSCLLRSSLQPEVGDDVEQLGQLALGPAVLDLLGQGEQRPSASRSASSSATVSGQPFLKRLLPQLPAGSSSRSSRSSASANSVAWKALRLRR